MSAQPTEGAVRYVTERMSNETLVVKQQMRWTKVYGVASFRADERDARAEAEAARRNAEAAK